MPIYEIVDQPQPSSELFAQLFNRFDGREPTIGEVISLAGPRAYALILLLFALPEALPLPVAGMSTILSIPLILVSLQMLLHGREPRPPLWLSQRRVPLGILKKVSKRIVQTLKRLERVSRPRWGALVGQTRVIGAVCLLLATVLALPIPFGNMLPALCIVGIALGMLRQDGALVACSITVGSIVVIGLSTAILLAAEAALALASGFLA